MWHKAHCETIPSEHLITLYKCYYGEKSSCDCYREFYESSQLTILLICIKQLYFGLTPAYSEIDDILDKLLELLSAANSTVHPVLSIFIWSTINNRNVA